MRLSVLLVAFASACIPGSIDGGGAPSPGPGPGPTPGESPDAGTSGHSPDASTTTGGGADASNCKNAVTANLSSGHHHAGEDCMQGCHNHGFTLSGTVFTSANGTTQVVGATVTVTDAANHTFDMITQLNGNFYTSNAITFPVTVVASLCPNTQPMSAQITAGNGGCNKSGCHQAGAQGYIHLP